MIFITFLSNVVFSIVLPSLPNYITDAKPNGFGEHAFWTGWAVSVNSFGTFIMSPLFGIWADKRSTREVMLFSLACGVVGNVWYAVAGSFWQLLIARFIVGISAANYAPAGAYLSYATPMASRTKIMAYNGAAQVLGFIAGPGFAAVTSSSKLRAEIGPVKFNYYTYPGWISAVFALLGTLALVKFKEVKRKTPEDASKTQERQIAKGASSECFVFFFFFVPFLILFFFPSSVRSGLSFLEIGKKKGMPVVGIVVCLYFSFICSASFTIFETLGSLYTIKVLCLLSFFFFPLIFHLRHTAGQI